MNRKDTIVEVADEARTDQVLLPDYNELDLYELVEDCTGFNLSDVERRLVVVAFEVDAATAKKSFWYS